MPELAERMVDAKRMSQLRDNAWRVRPQFTFDHHADRLLAFFRQVIEGHSSSRASIRAG